MHCQRCAIKMTEQKRVFHKQRKWICPRCGRVRMQPVGRKRKEKDTQ